MDNQEINKKGGLVQVKSAAYIVVLAYRLCCCASLQFLWTLCVVLVLQDILSRSATRVLVFYGFYLHYTASPLKSPVAYRSFC